MATRSPRSESGFALIEVIVSAAVLAIVSLAVLSGIDGANGASAREKARAVASNLAEQDQERLRAMPVELLKSPPLGGPKGDGVWVVDGVTYNVTSETKWITDDPGDSTKCGQGSKGVEYMHIVTTVKSSVVGKQIPPVVVDSLVAPTTEWAEDHGSLGVKVFDRTGTKGVPGVSVSATSDDFTPASVITDATGCAVFKSIPQGTYTITATKGGYLDFNANPQGTTSGGVVPKKLSFAQITYDSSTLARATFTTQIPGLAYSTANEKPSTAKALSWQNGARVGWSDTATSAGTATIDTPPLFPHTTAYQFFTGTCRYDAPNAYSANTNYYNATGGVNPAAALLADPSKSQPQVVTVRQPPLNLRIMRRSRSPVTAFLDTDVEVYARLQKPTTGVFSTDTCVEPIVPLYSMGWPGGGAPPTGWGTAPRVTGNPSGTTNNNHWVSKSSTAFDPGLPFGNYKICVFDKVANKWATQTYNNTTPDGNTTAAEVDFVASTWTSGTAGINGSCASQI